MSLISDGNPGVANKFLNALLEGANSVYLSLPPKRRTRSGYTVRYFTNESRALSSVTVADCWNAGVAKNSAIFKVGPASELLLHPLITHKENSTAMSET